MGWARRDDSPEARQKRSEVQRQRQRDTYRRWWAKHIATRPPVRTRRASKSAEQLDAEAREWLEAARAYRLEESSAVKQPSPIVGVDIGIRGWESGWDRV